MNERELLELAAKAAGYPIDEQAGAFWIPNVDEPEFPCLWNPLADDGDRYRLARICRLTIDFENGYVLLPDNLGHGVISFTLDDAQSEAYAIVRAAAAIGRAM